MLNGLSLRDERYFYVPSPVMEPSEPRVVQGIVEARVVRQLEGGVLLEASTGGGTVASVLLQLVGKSETLRCRVRAEGIAEEMRLVLARNLGPSRAQVTVSPESVTIAGSRVNVGVRLRPFGITVTSGSLRLDQDHTTEDASDRLVSLPLGLTLLRSGSPLYHDSFVAEPDEHFWGLGERFTGFNKRGQLVSCWNQDALGAQSAQSYKNVPFMLSSRGYGCFVDSTTNVNFDCCHSSQAFWSLLVPDEVLDYYLVFGSPRQCLAQYQDLVGGPELPPAWALGAWVSTGFLPFSEDDVVALVERLGAEGLPCDVLHLDAHWQKFGNWSDLLWDGSRFKDPAGMLSSVRKAGLKPCLWINSYIGPESPLFREADDAGYFLKRTDGTTYVGKLWGDYHPEVAVIDVTKPAARAWWAKRLAERLSDGAEIFKTDFGEAIPLEVVADNGLRGERLHNAYSLIYNDLVTSVMRDHGIEHPVVWGRSTWAGGQRHVGQWAGDPNSTWQDMASTLRAGLSMALSGHSFWSHDIGGFHGRPSQELYVRWAQFGLLSPLARFHGTTTRFPWDYGEGALAAVRAMLQLRYALHPYLYAAAAEYVRSGVPIMRPMVYEYPDDPVAQAADLQYLLGPDLLVAPFYRSGGSRPVWFPPGQWAHYRNGQVAQAGFQEVSLPTDVAPLWLRAGSSLLLTEPRQRIGDGRYDNLTVTFTTTRSSPPRAVRLVVTSYGEAAISVEPTSDGGVAISTPPGLPRLDVVVVGNQPIAGVVTINGTPVASRTSSSLMSEQTRRALGGQEREGGGRPDD